VRQVRTHLHGIRDRFLDGDSLASAQGYSVVGYRDVPSGGELSFTALDAALVAALHDWFNAQTSVEEANAVVAHLHDRGPSGSR
jgi:hypothetical protein